MEHNIIIHVHCVDTITCSEKIGSGVVDRYRGSTDPAKIQKLYCSNNRLLHQVVR